MILEKTSAVWWKFFLPEKEVLLATLMGLLFRLFQKN